MTLSAEDGLEETMLIDTLYGEPIVLPDNSIQRTFADLFSENQKS
jgi:hypothetical protein